MSQEQRETERKRKEDELIPMRKEDVQTAKRDGQVEKGR